MAGCAADFNKNASSPAPLAPLVGKVHGGQQPVTGAQVFLLAAGVAGYGTAARSMLAAPGYTATDATGAFSITGSYTCQPGDQVYLLATGGNPGLPAGSNNPALSLMAALGPCSALTPSTFINIDEVTTVAAAYALAGFMTSPTTLSSSGTPLAKVGVANAFLNAANLANFTTGTANTYTAGGNGYVPASEINTLADILASCVNSTGSTTACTTLFAASTPASGAAPTDTAQAILNLAHSPGLNVAALYALATPTAPFQPTLPAAPHDWSLAVTYAGASLPDDTSMVATGLSVDGQGNVWVITGPVNDSPQTGSLSVFAPTGEPVSPTGYTAGVTAPGSLAAFALDRSNNAWVAAYDATSNRFLAKTDVTGTVLSPPGGYTGGGLFNMNIVGLIFDSAGNVWAGGDQCCGPYKVAQFNGVTGAPISPATGYLDPNTGSAPFSLFATPGQTVWAGGIEFSSTGTVLANLQFAPFVSQPQGAVAIDASGNIWSGQGQTLAETDSSGHLISPANGYTTGLQNADSVVTDGLNRLWFHNGVYSGYLGVMDNSGNILAPAGYRLPNDPFKGSFYKDIDPSGNIWLATNNQTLVEFVGIAAPVVRPLATAVATNSFGVRP